MRIFAAALTALTLASPALAAPSDSAADIDQIQVYNEQNEKLGEAHEVLVTSAGRVEGLVVKVAIEGEQAQGDAVVVPIDRVKMAEQDGKVVISASKDELKAMPKVPDAASDTRAGNKI